MKRQQTLTSILALVLLLTLTVSLTLAQRPGPQGELTPQDGLGTGFTYQGQLRSGGEPVTDDCRMAFRLYDHAAQGGQVGSPITTAVPITDGLFTVGLDFGPDVFTGDARWLGIQVECPDDAGYADLGRQQLTAAPYAVYARSTGALQGYPVTTTMPDVDQILKWDGGTWALASDEVGSGGSGDITAVYAGKGLTGGGTSDAVTLTLVLPVPTATLALSATQAPWSGLTGVPAGFADGVDDVMAVVSGTNIFAGDGLTQVSTGDSVTMTVYFAGSGGDYGTAISVARSDHAHGLIYAALAHTHSGSDVTSPVPTATLALSITQAPWSGLAGIPAGFADGVDDDTLHNLLCTDEQVAKWNDTAGEWACGADEVGAGGTDWSLTGNADTDASTHFLGTTDGVSLTLAVSGTVALRLEPTGSTPNLIGGYSGNNVTNGVFGASIGGGGADWGLNRITDEFGTVSGGANNQAGDNAGGVGDAPYAVVGGGHLNTAGGNSATVAGGNTNIAGAFAAVGGGYSNTASGDSATIAGGNSNTASGEFAATIGGGYQNIASDYFATVGGGLFNHADAVTATIGGGEYISVTGQAATVAGGSHITVTGDYAAVGGGLYNVVTATYAVVGGGYDNIASDFGATVDGGIINRASNLIATVSGGGTNTASGWGSTVGGGANNIASGYIATIGGGGDNNVSDIYTTVGGGWVNTASGQFATVGGGDHNTASGVYAFVGGGIFNFANAITATIGGGEYINVTGHAATVAGGSHIIVTGDYAAVGGGRDNEVTDSYATIGGGRGNVASDAYATVSGGMNGTASGIHATVGGGLDNTASGYYATVGGGYLNGANGYAATIAGGWNTAATGDYATAGGGVNNNAIGIEATVGGGRGNTASNQCATVNGGTDNLSSGQYATVGGGQSNTVTATHATVGGGFNNTATGNHAAISGGNSNDAIGIDSTIAGGASNLAYGTGAFVGGGMDNEAMESFTTIAGGQVNHANGNYATVGGGWMNAATGDRATVGGGYENEAISTESTVAGGADNHAGYRATVGGGLSNFATASYATVPGGHNNVADGEFSFAAGRRAHAYTDGSFVWADSNDFDFAAASTSNQFRVRATGGAYFVMAIDGSGNSTWTCSLSSGSSWSCSSDRDLKENLVLVDGTETLERLSQVPIFTWNAREQDPLVRHIGPMAQDFYATFEVGQDGRHIATIDLDGVALAAIQGLYQLLQEKDAQIVAQQDQIDDLEARVTALEEVVGATTQSCSRWSDFLPGGNVLLLGLSLVWAIRQSGILKPSVERPPTVAYPSQTAAFSSRRASRVTHLLGRLRFSSGQVRETEPHSHCPRSF